MIQAALSCNLNKPLEFGYLLSSSITDHQSSFIVHQHIYHCGHNTWVAKYHCQIIKRSYFVLKPATRLDLFVNQTLLLSIDIKYCVRDLLCDVNNYNA